MQGFGDVQFLATNVHSFAPNCWAGGAAIDHVSGSESHAHRVLMVMRQMFKLAISDALIDGENPAISSPPHALPWVFRFCFVNPRSTWALACLLASCIPLHQCRVHCCHDSMSLAADPAHGIDGSWHLFYFFA